MKRLFMLGVFLIWFGRDASAGSVDFDELTFNIGFGYRLQSTDIVSIVNNDLKSKYSQWDSNRHYVTQLSLAYETTNFVYSLDHYSNALVGRPFNKNYELHITSLVGEWKPIETYFYGGEFSLNIGAGIILDSTNLEKVSMDKYKDRYEGFNSKGRFMSKIAAIFETDNYEFSLDYRTTPLMGGKESSLYLTTFMINRKVDLNWIIR